MIDPIAVPQNTNAEAAVADHWGKMDLVGLCVTAATAHTVEADAPEPSQKQGVG